MDRRAGRRAGRVAQRPGAAARRAQAGWPAARRRGVERRVRPCPHVRQPLRVLLHLPAAQGPAPQPVPEGRRLPAELPLRELHDADALHRGRPRAGRHRAAVAAAREHPLDRSRVAGAHAAQPARRHQPALASCPARPRHRGARAARRVPRRQRRPRPRRHVRRHPRSLPGALVGRRRAARHLPVQPGDHHARPHHGRGRGRRRRRGGLAGRVPRCARSPHGPRRRRVLPDGRPAVPGRRCLRGLHDARGRHRHGPHVRAGVRRGDGRADGHAARVLRRRRRLRRLPASEPGGLHRPAG